MDKDIVELFISQSLNFNTKNTTTLHAARVLSLGTTLLYYTNNPGKKRLLPRYIENTQTIEIT